MKFRLTISAKKIIVFSLVFLLFACFNQSDENKSVFNPLVYNKSYTPVFSSNACSEFSSVPAWFLSKAENIENTECGVLTVPESRYDVENLNSIKIAVLILKAFTDSPSSDPLIHLHGGPGGGGLRFTSFFSSSVFLEARNERDIILVDQRGSGSSTPLLTCPEERESLLEKLGSVSDGSELPDVFDYLPSSKICKMRLEQEGIDLSAYTTIENASDINDLRLALGIDQWNLYGVSYGGILAQTIMKYYPEGVRSVILDSPGFVAKSGLDVATVVKPYTMLNNILAECAQNMRCVERYPDLEARFWAKVISLTETPDVVDIEFENYGIDIKNRLFGGSDLIGYVNVLLDGDMAEFLPHFITKILDGDYSHMIRVFEQELSPSDFSVGSLYSIFCADEKQKAYPESSIDDVNFSERFNTYRDDWKKLYKTINDTCDIWPHSLDKGVIPQPLVSSIPALIMGGKYDIRTPVESVKTIGDTLSVSTYVEFPDEGHGVLFNECSQTIRDEFISSPFVTPNTACVDEIEVALDFYIRN